MRTGVVSRRIFLLLLVALFLYLSIYTWNLRYGYLDRLTEITGLEIAGTVLRPGNWAADEVNQRWRRYVHLVDVEQENERLRAAVARMALDMASLREDSAKAKRLERSLGYNPPEEWQRQGARVIAHRLGPTGNLETFLVDKGAGDGIYEDAPAITADGAVGRVMRVSPNNSTVLLLSDPNSRIPVLGRDSRTTGVLVGHGQGELLSVNYVPLNEPMEVGEVLVSSGLARVFPKGIPVARVVTVDRSDISLFKTVLAEPLVDVRNLEEVLLLTRLAVEQPATVQTEAVIPAAPPTKPAATGAVQPKAGRADAQAPKTAVAQPQDSRRQGEQVTPARQERSPDVQKKPANPQAGQAPLPQDARTQTPPAAQAPKPQEGQAPKPQTVQTSRPRETQPQTQPLPSAGEQRANPAQERQPLVREPEPKPQAGTPRAANLEPLAQVVPVQPGSAQAAPDPTMSAPASRTAEPEAAARVARTTPPAPPARTEPKSESQTEGTKTQPIWPPALQAPPPAEPAFSQSTPSGLPQPAEQP